MPDRMPTHPRNSARALLFDADKRLVVIKRTRPGRASYYTTPGGGVEAGENCTGAVHRELIEELGATVILGRLVHVEHDPNRSSSAQYFYLARAIEIDPDQRCGAEFDDPAANGSYDMTALDLSDSDGVKALQPQSLITLLAEKGQELCREALESPTGRPTSQAE